MKPVVIYVNLTIRLPQGTLVRLTALSVVVVSVAVLWREGYSLPNCLTIALTLAEITRAILSGTTPPEAGQ